jgi:hypothetical protein
MPKLTVSTRRSRRDMAEEFGRCQDLRSMLILRGGGARRRTQSARGRRWNRAASSDRELLCELRGRTYLARANAPGAPSTSGAGAQRARFSKEFGRRKRELGRISPIEKRASSAVPDRRRVRSRFGLGIEGGIASMRAAGSVRPALPGREAWGRVQAPPIPDRASFTISFQAGLARSKGNRLSSLSTIRRGRPSASTLASPIVLCLLPSDPTLNPQGVS